MMPSENEKASSNPYEINLENFSKRLKELYSNLKVNEANSWGDADALAIATPAASEDLLYLNTKKASLLEVVKKAAKYSVGVDVLMHVKVRNEDGASQMDTVLKSVRSSKDQPEYVSVVGYLSKEAPKGKLLELWMEKLKNSQLKSSDITNGLSDLFAVKDIGELVNIKKAVFLSASVMKTHVVPKLEKVIDEEEKLLHSALIGEVEKAILEPTRVKVKLKAENVLGCGEALKL